MKSEGLIPHESVIFQPWTKGTQPKPMNNYCKIHGIKDDENTVMTQMLVENVCYNKKFHHAMDIIVPINILYTLILSVELDCRKYSFATSNCASFSRFLIDVFKEYKVKPKDNLESQWIFPAKHTPNRKFSLPTANLTEFYVILQHTLPFLIINSRTFPKANCFLAVMLLIILLSHIYCETVSFRNVWKNLKTVLIEKKCTEDHTESSYCLIHKIMLLYTAIILSFHLFTNESISSVTVLWYASAMLEAKRREFFTKHQSDFKLFMLHPTIGLAFTHSVKKVLFVCLAECLPGLIISLSSVLPHNLFIWGNLLGIILSVIIVRWSYTDTYACGYLSGSLDSLFGTHRPKLQEIGVVLYMSFTAYAFFQGSNVPEFHFEHLWIQFFNIVTFFLAETYYIKPFMEKHLKAFKPIETEQLPVRDQLDHSILHYFLYSIFYTVKYYWVMGIIFLCSLVVVHLLQWHVYLYLIFTIYGHLHLSCSAFILRSEKALIKKTISQTIPDNPPRGPIYAAGNYVLYSI